MTITAQTSKTGPYSGNGTTTVFSYTFEVQDEAHLVVTLADSQGVETVQVLNTDYTVSGVGNANGGQITMSTAPAAGYTLTISRNVPITQEVDLENRRSVAPEVLEDAYDKLTQIAQDLSEQVGRSLKISVTEGGTPNTSLQGDVVPNSFVGFGPDGNFSTLTPPSGAYIAAGSSLVAVDAFTGDGVTVAFTMGGIPASAGNVFVYIDGVMQDAANYSVSGTTLTFSTAPPLNSNIEMRRFQGISTNPGATTADLVTYSPAGTGAQNTTVETKLREFVSVKDFGAVGDGVTDDTVAIQAAINYSVSGGKSLYVPPGTYIISSMVYEQTNGARLNIFGAGRTSSIFKGSAALTNTAMFWFGNNSGHAVYGLFMSDIGLDGSLTTNCTGIVATECGLSHFNNMRIYNWNEGANCDGSIHMIWDGHNEITSCQFGIRFRRIPTGTPSGPFDKSVTSHPIPLATNVSKIENVWFSSVSTNAVVAEGGLFTIENCVFQGCGADASQSIVILNECNESYDYGGGPRFVNNWVESGVYKYWVEVINTRNAILCDNFYSGPSAGTAEGAFLLHSGCENCIISGNSFRGIASASATEGRKRSSAAVYLDASDAVSFTFTIKDNYVTKNTLNYVIDGVNITGDSSWRYSVFSDMNGTPPAVYDAGGSLAYMPDKTIHATGSVTYSAGTPTLDFASNVSSIVDSGVGYLSVVYSRGKAINNQPLTATVNAAAGTPLISNTIRVSSTVDRIIVYNTSGTQTDPDGISFTCLGGTL